MRITARGAMQTRADSQKLVGFGQMWQPGDQGTAYYPVITDEKTGKLDLLVGCIWGHPADPKALGLKTIFIPSLTDMDESGVPVGTPDITYQFAKIAKAFIDGEKQSKIDKAMSKNWPTEAARKAALDEIENEFDTKNNMKAKKPVVGKVKLLITTEVLYVPIENDVPQPDKARVVTQSLSDERIRKLIALLDDSKYAPGEGEDYLEVQYNFPATDKAQAGKADPVGQVPEYRLKVKFPEQWKSIESQLELLPKNSETIARRNFSYRKFDEKKIKNALTTYSIMQSEYLEKLHEDDTERLIKNAEIMDTLSIPESLADCPLKEQLNAEIERIRNERAAAGVEAPAEETHEEPSFTGAPTLNDMLQNENRASDEFVDGIDVSLS